MPASRPTGAEPIDLRQVAPDLRAELIDLGPVVLGAVALLSLELVDRHAQPPGFHLGRFLLHREAVPGREGRLEFGVAVAEQRREPLGLGPGGRQVGLRPLHSLAVLPLLGGGLVDHGPELGLKPLDLAPQPLGLGCQGTWLLRQRPDLGRRDPA